MKANKQALQEEYERKMKYAADSDDETSSFTQIR